MPVRAVFFDIGETLVDESEAWGAWADWLGVSRLTLGAALGSVIERADHHRTALHVVRPGLDFAAEERARDAAGLPRPEELFVAYPDAAPCLAALRAAGLRVGIAGNQRPAAVLALARLGLEADVVATSAGWGVAKPDPAFFARVAALAQVPAHEIAYVGDRVDNDVEPARAAGMIAVHLRRGPWGVLQAARATGAALRLDDLGDLPAHLARL
jgi:HAD superfamily hydrolase (TIGR01549 family)